MMIPSIQKHTLFLTIVTLSVSLQATSPYPEMPEPLQQKRKAHIELIEGLVDQLNGKDQKGIEHAQEKIEKEITAHALARNAKICRNPWLYATLEWITSWFNANSTTLETELSNTKNWVRAEKEKLQKAATFYQKIAKDVVNSIEKAPKQLKSHISDLNGLAIYVVKESPLSDNDKKMLQKYDPECSIIKNLIIQKALKLYGEGVPLTYEELETLLFKNPDFRQKAQTADSLQTKLTEIYNKEFGTTYTHYPVNLSTMHQNYTPTEVDNSNSAGTDGSENTVES